MRRLLTLFVAFFSCLVAWGQSAIISGRFFDLESKEGVVGAIIEITTPRDSLFRRHYTTGYGGYFKTPPLPRGEYKLTSTFLGYEDYERSFKVDALPVNLGDMAMKQAAINVGLVVKEIVVPRATIIGDTLKYTASQFKVTADAELENLLRKLPGISINNGKIEAQGEAVTKIYVDGEEFFGGGVQQVLQSIPAQAVESIEIYNRMSEASQITGVDDGRGGKVINIKTKSSLSHSEFGKMHAAGGIGSDRTPVRSELGKYTDRLKGRYSTGGALNIFRDDTRIAIMALVNNLNKQNLSDEGISMSGSTNRSNASSSFSVNRQSGVAATELLALNYSDRWGQRKRARFDGSIFFNHSNSENQFAIDRWYNAPAKLDTIHYDQYANPNNLNLRLRGRLSWKVAKRQRLLITPTYSYTNNFSINRQDTTSMRSGWSESVPEKDRPLPRYYPSYNEGRSITHNASINAQYNYNFLKRGRVLLISANGRYNGNDSWRRYNSYSGTQPIDSLRKYSYSLNNTSQTTAEAHLQATFRERIGRWVILNASYEGHYQKRFRDIYNFTTDDTYEAVNEKIKPKSSSIYTSDYWYHEASAGMRYGKGRNWFSINLRFRDFTTDVTYFGVPGRMLATPTVKRSHYQRFLYNATVNIAANNKHSMRASFNSRLRMPGIWDLNDMYNVNNSSYLSVGNPDLKPSQEHNFFVRYTNVSSRFGTTFMMMAKVQHVQDYVGFKVAYEPGKIRLPDYLDDKGEWHYANYNPLQLSQKVNLDGYWSYEFRTSLGLPLKYLRSNLNIVLGGTYSDIPMEVVSSDLKPEEIVDPEQDYKFIARGENVMMHNANGYAQVTLGSNISENVDFMVTWRGNYAYNDSTISGFNNQYFMQYVRANIKAVLPLGFTITSSLNFTHFKVFTHNFDDNFTLWNISIGKKVLNQLGEVELCVNDVLNKNTSFGRYVIATYSQLRYNSVLGRTYLVRFTYNLRNLGGSKRRNKTIDVPQDPLGDIQSKLDALKF
ncbi:MAG: TonB-dependent receptor [Rikenellaceae bacterium]|nr:TonB-dependent receptor [Rikenellaceae bacterium]